MVRTAESQRWHVAWAPLHHQPTGPGSTGNSTGEPQEEAQRESRAPAELSNNVPPMAEAMRVTDLPPKSLANPNVIGLFFFFWHHTDQKGKAAQRERLFLRSAFTDHNPHGLGQVFLEHFFSSV